MNSTMQMKEPVKDVPSSRKLLYFLVLVVVANILFFLVASSKSSFVLNKAASFKAFVRESYSRSALPLVGWNKTAVPDQQPRVNNSAPEKVAVKVRKSLGHLIP